MINVFFDKFNNHNLIFKTTINNNKISTSIEFRGFITLSCQIYMFNLHEQITNKLFSPINCNRCDILYENNFYGLIH